MQDKPVRYCFSLLFCILYLVAALPLAFSQTPASVPPAAGQIGIVAAVRGSVQITRPGQVGQIAGSGHPVCLGDEVKTDAEGRLQIMLLDETVFTIGPNSCMVIDKFVYDPANQNGEVKAKILKGTFRFVTGKIARKKPSHMTVELPSGTIGIRGTIVNGETDGVGSTAALMGPGGNNNAGYAGGGFSMANDVGGQTEQTDIDQPGYGATIPGPGQAPSGAFLVGDDLLNRWANALNPSGGGGGSGLPSGGAGGSATDTSGQSTAGAGATNSSLQQVTGLTSSLQVNSNQSSQDSTSNSGGGIPNGTTTYDQLRTLASQSSGSAYWSQQNVKLYDTYGYSNYTYNLTYYIDFANRTVGGGSSSLVIKDYSVGSTTINLPTLHGFAVGAGNAVFTDSSLSGTGSAGSFSNGTLTVTLNNRNGIIADTATHSLNITSGSSTQLSGGGTTGSRQASSGGGSIGS
jgi:hypothetical protein